MLGRAAIAAVGIALVAAGCGGGGKPPAVASLAPSQDGTPTTDTTTTGNAPAEGAPGTSGSGGGPGQYRLAMRVPPGADGAKFSACMRSHGLPDFPDPNGQGIIQLSSGSGVDPASPKFRAAQGACQKLLPNGGHPTAAQIAKAQRAALAFAACMRSHGVTDFPDPSFTGGGVQFRVGGTPGSDLDPSSALFQRARAACQADLPGKIAPGPGAGGK